VSSIDRICPEYVGEERIQLSLAEPGPTTRVRAFDVVIVSVDVSGTLPEGLVLPLEWIVTGPTRDSFRRDVFRRSIPSRIVFRPNEGGIYLLRLAEMHHNRWWGSLTIPVIGDRAMSSIGARRP
jgi:hypothetical protein